MIFYYSLEFFVQIIFGAISLLIGYTILGFNSKFLGHNLSTFLVYIWARIFEGSEVNVMDIIYLKAELLPWFFCIQTLLLDGEIPFSDMLGIAIGHLYLYLSKNKYIQVPDFIKGWFESDAIKSHYVKFKDDFE
jgi:Derlin-2/3